MFFCIFIDFHLVSANEEIYINRLKKEVELNLPS